MKHKICLCPASIAWIARNLKKTAKAKFRLLISSRSITNIRTKRRRSRSLRRFTKTKRKRAWMVKGSKAAKAHMKRVRNARK